MNTANELMEIMIKRRSVRNYTGAPISEDKLDMILKAGLLAPSGRNRKPAEFVVVRDKALLEKLAVCRPAGAGMLQMR